MVLFKTLDLARFSILDQPQDIIALHNDLLLLLSSQVGTDDLGNDLGVQHLLELVNRTLVL